MEKNGTLGTVATASLTLILSYLGFRELLIRFHEWRIGHKLVFTIHEEIRAIPLAILTSVIVTLLVRGRLKRGHD